MTDRPINPTATRRHNRPWPGLGVVVLCLLAWPCAAAQSWTEFVAGLGPAKPPPAVLEYLKQNKLVQNVPKPAFSTIKTETVDHNIAQSFRLVGFEDGFGRIEGTREERAQGNRRSGQQTLSMVTALAGVILVSLDNKTTGASVYLRKIELHGELLPPSNERTVSMKYERVQHAKDVVVEEILDCALTWIRPDLAEPLLQSRCTGSNRITRPVSDGGIKVETLPDNSSATFVFRKDMGWIFNQQTRVLEFKP